ncbi:nucleotidyltransferase family protein [Desulfovibrio inopinatus]|uniref:nucleotidyltransferase family protein n=1 Tax=Desulfovibrio inopinatus TaxID=102109 RepID=UPI000487659F|nr:nucleotidyltransferase domain-containing protein [Desulfovibrio inopinatus]
MRYGLRESILHDMVAVFKKYPHIERVVLYGSRAKGCFKPGSDIDICLYGKNITTMEKNLIAIDLDELDLPYIIDIAVFDSLSHAALRELIERVGIVLYQRLGTPLGAR